MSHPRKIYVIQLEHFDILFPQDSIKTAKLIADTADSLYEAAKEKIGLKKDFRIPIIISPDSDELSVSYTASPYNRIIVMDGVPEAGRVSYQQSLQLLLYRELCVAISSSIRSPFNQFISDTIAGSTYQPVALINLPFSFIQGRAALEIDDQHNLQLLIQAKLENQFPSYYQASVSYDAYPGNDLIIAACSAFSAYLIQTYGYEKYCDLWNECGAFHPFLMEGIFHKIYGKFLIDLWNDFEASIPMPEFMEAQTEIQQLTQTIFEFDKDGLYSNILQTEYGLIWYDARRHEVDILDKNSEIKLRQLLFLANDIDCLTLSPDGRYMAVSFTQVKSEDVFKKDVAWIYDIKEREFLDENEYELREASIITMNGEPAIIGVAILDKIPEIQVWNIPEDEDDKKLLYSKKMNDNVIPSDFVFADDNEVFFLLYSDGMQYLCRLNLADNEEQIWNLAGSNHNITALRNLKIAEVQTEASSKKIMIFEYEISAENTLTRLGYIPLNKENEPALVFLQKKDINGGVHYPLVYEDNLFYVEKKLTYNSIKQVPFNVFEYEKGECLLLSQKKIAELDLGERKESEEIFFDGEKLNEYSLRTYNPFKYMLPLSVVPFLPVREISVEEGAEKWPGLGVSINTNSDPFMNNEILFSAGWNYFPLEITKLFNVSDRVLNEDLHEQMEDKKDKSLAFYLKNTSTPVDIQAGVLFKYNLFGEYDFKTTAGTKWQIPLGMNFSKLLFNIETTYTASTDYYDPDYVNINESLQNWPSFNDAYELASFSISAAYTNIHQYGRSPYEKRGLSFGARLYSMWDLYEIRLLQEKRDLVLKELEESGEQTELTKAQVDKMYNENLILFSQLNAGAFATIEIPRLTPLSIKNGWILSVPTTISAEFLNTNGTAVEAGAEFLLLGKEIHDGIPFLQLYFSRFGLKAGYNLRMNYDTAEVARPDIRKNETISAALTQTALDDNLFLVLNVDLSSPIGAASSCIYSTMLKFSYYPRTAGMILNFSFIAKF